MDDQRQSQAPAVLVTGGAGYVGSHACKALASAGYRPVVYDNLCRGHASAVRWGELIEGDLLDTAELTTALRRVRPVAVMHFAAFAYVGESMSEPERYWRNNVTGTASLLDAMRAALCRRLVFSSSCAVYGGVHAQPIDETTTCAPMSTYGWTKLVCEQMARDAVRAHGLSAVALRYFNAAGADPDGEIGEDHEPEPHIIPTVLRVAAGRLPDLTINGSDHPTFDGTCVRDFVHVSDLAEAHVLALAHTLRASSSFEVFNLGSGTGYSLNEIVETARHVTGAPIRVHYAARRPGDPPYAVGSAGRAREVLGWSPGLSSLDQMLQHAWRWMTASRTEAKVEFPKIAILK